MCCPRMSSSSRERQTVKGFRRARRPSRKGTEIYPTDPALPRLVISSVTSCIWLGGRCVRHARATTVTDIAMRFSFDLTSEKPDDNSVTRRLRARAAALAAFGAARRLRDSGSRVGPRAN
jgi:hypothetical protein